MPHAISKLAQLMLVASATVAAITNVAAQTPSEFDKHLNAATRNAIGDPGLLQSTRKYLCMYPEDRQDLVGEVRSGASTPVPLTRIADDAWYIGNRYVGQYILRSGTGFVLIDSLDNTAEAQQFTLPALQSLGLDVNLPLETLLLTHGHFDHDGGAAFLKSALDPKIYIGSGDAAGKPYAPLVFDSKNLSPRPVQAGGRTITLMPTPGHTPGTTAYVVPVHDNGRVVNLLVSGGSGMVATVSASRNYLDSVERTYGLAKAMNVEGGMHPHPILDGSLPKIDQIMSSGLTKPSQFVVGNDRYLRHLAIWRECAAAFAAKVDSTAVIPEWRASAIEFVSGSPSPNRVSAKLFNGWGPLANQKVTFTVADRGAACSAITDQNGVATCRSKFGPFRAGADVVTASFDGGTYSDHVDLGSRATANVDNACGDWLAVRAAMSAKRGDDQYDERLDFDQNGVIDGSDLSTAVRGIQPGLCK
jgi:glyoxylase-like metal-dependent hydrolase (beta-lactamase superfamily II)